MTIPSFHLFVQTLILGVLVGGVYALMASGLTLIFGVMRVINVAHGAFLILGAYITYVLFQNFQIDPIASILITIPIFFAVGWLLQRYMLSRIANPEQTSVLVTFALALVMEGLLGIIFQTTARSVTPSYTSQALMFATYRFPVTRLMGFGIALLIILSLYLILQYTKLGRAIRATTQDPRAAQLMGINTSMISAFTFALGVATTAAGGSLLSIIYSFNPSSQSDWIAKTLSIIVLGGLGSIPGALIAALILGMMEQMTAIVVTLYWSPIVFYFFLFITLIIRPQGLMGEIIREKG